MSGFYCSERSGSKKRMKVAITGKHKPKKNQMIGFLPMRFASRAVIIGMLNKNKIPRLTKRTAPMNTNVY